jgi:hypothetical protein
MSDPTNRIITPSEWHELRSEIRQLIERYGVSEFESAFKSVIKSVMHDKTYAKQKAEPVSSPVLGTCDLGRHKSVLGEHEYRDTCWHWRPLAGTEKR